MCKCELRFKWAFFLMGLVFLASGLNSHGQTLPPGLTVTTNETGILSPYGEFFPTEPGPTVLVTMPDLETGQRGTSVVWVVKIQLDVNRDKIMQTHFSSPDNTSQARPFRFWVNNDYDAPGLYGDATQDHDVNAPSVPDYNYSAPVLGNSSRTCIHSQRDLEDYARLWLCGIPPLPANGGYQVTLRMNALSGNPTVKLFPAVESNGGTAYLTDTNVAAAQVSIGTWNPGFVPGPGHVFCTVSPTTTFMFPSTYFTNYIGTRHFLFEGAGIGKGELVLTISQVNSQGATNVLMTTSTFLDLRDVKDMYERAHIEGVTDTTPPSFASTYKQDNYADQDEGDKKLIVFVHGWRMGIWDYFNFSESMFKRLYWQGYQGRFIALRWPTMSKDDFKVPILDLFTYNRSEFRAFKSGKGVSDYFTNLSQRFPDYTISVCAHSMGNIVMMEALKNQLAASRQDIFNYVLMQAAVPSHCYDASLTNYAPFIAAEVTKPTPDTYRGYPGAIDDALSGFLVNFYNTNDFALATGTVLSQPVHWEGNEVTYKPDSGFGYTSNGTNGFKNSVLLTENREVMPFVARPRSKAVGARPGVSGVIAVGEQVDLRMSFGFDTDKSEHSAQFNWNIQRLNGFYAQLLTSLFQ